jgi:hypothetical protein
MSEMIHNFTCPVTVTVTGDICQTGRPPPPAQEQPTGTVGTCKTPSTPKREARYMHQRKIEYVQDESLVFTWYGILMIVCVCFVVCFCSYVI